MKTWMWIVGVIILVAIVVAGMFYYLPKGGHFVTENNTLIHAGSVVEANNLFSFDLYNKINSGAQNQGKNVFVSPYSISTALTMTYEGARGQTAKEMSQVLHLPTDINLIRESSREIISRMNAPGLLYKLNTANALWIQNDFNLSSEYQDVVKNYYGGEATNLDFRAKAEDARIIINDWVAQKTNDRIKDIIPRGILDSSTRLVLTNTIYFKANWSIPFDSDFTQDKDFTTSSKEKVKVKMMTNTQGFNYAETNELQAIEMNYVGNEISMIVVLPKGSVDSLVIDSGKLSGIKNSMKAEKVDVSLPRFSFETKYFMKGMLEEMGMPTAFSGSANFSGMNPEESLAISQVIHQTFINVTEEGTEAAAATVVVIGETSIGPGEVVPPKVFNANHPFLFFIQEKSTGNILFMGKVEDPTK